MFSAHAVVDVPFAALVRTFILERITLEPSKQVIYLAVVGPTGLSRHGHGCDEMNARKAALLIGICVSSLIPAAHADSQVVRGVVRDRETGMPVAGALVTLEPADSVRAVGRILHRTASRQEGTFFIQSSRPGQFLLTVRRIGTRAYSEVLTLGENTVRVMDVYLERVSALAAVTVVDSSLCISRGAVGMRVASLWDAARTALSLVAISVSDTAKERRLVRYRRTLDPNDQRIIEESLRSYDVRDGLNESLFKSLSGDSLSKLGYWRSIPPQSMEFYAPDADALLSDAFLRDHCFGLKDGADGSENVIGLTFEPVRGRRAAEIRGTMWLHRETAELQSLEFNWLGLPPVSRHPSVGGRVQYKRLPTGAWYVRRWALVMPSPGARLAEPAADFGERLKGLLHEEGGVVVLYGSEEFGAPGTVEGRVLFTSGSPLRRARVRLVGTPFATTVDSAGRFRFDSVPSGPHAIVVEHDDFASLGVRVAEQEFLLDEGTKRSFVFRAPTEEERLERACPGRDERSATLRILAVSSGTQLPVENADLKLSWTQLSRTYRGRSLVEAMIDQWRDVRTDAGGRAVFCSVAPSLDLLLTVERNGETVELQRLKLNPKQVRLLTVEVP